jgi:hypothetical protein
VQQSPLLILRKITKTMKHFVFFYLQPKRCLMKNITMICEAIEGKKEQKNGLIFARPTSIKKEQ